MLRRFAQTTGFLRSLIGMKITAPLFLFLFAGLLSVGAQEDAPPAGVRILGTAPFQTASEIYCLSFSVDSRRLAAGTSQNGIVGGDLETAQEGDRLPPQGPITDVRCLSDGRRMAYMMMFNSGPQFGQGLDGTVIFDLQDRKDLLQVPTPSSHGRFEISPDEKLLLTPERKDYRDQPGVLGWDLTNGKPAPGLEEVARHAPQVQYRVSSMSFTADGS